MSERHFFSDTKKMPLGKLSKAQIAKGFEVIIIILIFIIIITHH